MTSYCTCKKRIKQTIFLFFLSFIIVSCATRHPDYWEAHHSFIDKNHEIRIEKSSSYCPVKGPRGWHKKNLKGQFLYRYSCGTENPIFIDSQDALEQGQKMVQKMCDGDLPEYVGRKQSKRHVGTTSTSCFNFSNYNSFLGHTFGSTVCRGGNPVYAQNTSHFFRCPRKVYKNLCDNGDMKGCSNLGVLEQRKKNIANARKLFQKSCDGGDMKGCSNLGTLEKEQGNIANARKVFSKSCNDGDMSGCSHLGVLEKEEGDISNARKLFKKSCDRGHMEGCSNLGNLEYNQRNIAKAGKLFKKSCDGGDMKGCSSLGITEYNQGNVTNAKRLLKKSCNIGYMRGCFHLGVLEYNELGNITNAKKMFKKSCDGGYMEGCSSRKTLEKSGRRISSDH